MKKTLSQLLLNQIEVNSYDKKIFFTKEKENYSALTLEGLMRKIYSLTKYLQGLDLKPGDKVAIISENRIEWVIADFACIFLKLISVPIYTSQTPSQIVYILENSESRVCFVSNLLQFEKVKSISNELPLLIEIISFNDIDKDNYKNFRLKLNKEIEEESGLSTEKILQFLKTLAQQINDDDIFTIIYTSGTTGIPKGVMLTHKNVHSNVIACQKVLVINSSDTFLSYLPYCHIYERTAGYYLALFSGAKVYYAQSIETIAPQLAETNPTIVITVPRLLDKIYTRLLKSGDEMKDGLKKKLFAWAINYANGKVNKLSPKWLLANGLVYKKIRAKTGNSLRFFVSGGGALNKSIGKFFDNIGITTLEGYGLTETSPVVSVNPPEKNKYGTVGKPLEGVSIKLTEENEILVSGDLVMAGYYKDKNYTDEVIKDGWFYTGDIGKIDEEGYLNITDRKKSLFKTSGGKYVSPTQIEDLIMSLSYIENAVVIGNERMYVTALLTPARDELIAFAKRNNISFNSYSDLVNDKSLHKLITRDIEEVQKPLSSYERVRKFKLLENTFSIETGELTPTLKIKRKIVEDKYRKDIEQMYLKV